MIIISIKFHIFHITPRLEENYFYQRKMSKSKNRQHPAHQFGKKIKKKNIEDKQIKKKNI